MNISTKSHEPQIAHINKTTNTKAALKSFLLAFLLLCGHFTLSAATITVTNGNDAGAGSLRQAIASANVMGGDIIVFDMSVTTVTITSDQLFIDKSLTINGGTGVTITRDAGAANFRIFNITGASAVVEFNKLTITNGKAIPPVGNQAAGIQNSGTLTLNDCTLANNESGVQSGGIQNDKILTMNRCFVYNNSATTAGGGSGLLIYGSSTTLNNCVFTNNQGAYAIDVRASGTLTITNCTIAKNTNGGINIGNGSAVVTLKNTIVAENTAASSPNINGNNLSSSAYNLIGTEGGNGGLTNGTNNNIVGVSPQFANSSDPDGADNIFGTADDGLMLTACNFATNVGNNADAPSGTDVAGNTRIFNTTVDIGAYEFQASSSPNPTITLGAIPAILAGATSFTIPYTATSSPTTYSISGTGFTTLTDAALPSSPITVNLSPAASINIDFTLTVKNANGCTSSAKTGGITVLTPLTDACATATFNGTAPIAPTTTTAGVGGKGGIHTYTVPAGVTAIRLDARGAKGGKTPENGGGQGGRVQAIYAVMPGDVLHILVGGKGGDAASDGNVIIDPVNNIEGHKSAAGGGGATVVSKGPIGSGTLLLVAGGGGGAGDQGVGGVSNNFPGSGAGARGAGGASFSANGGNTISIDNCGQGGQALNAGGNGGANTCFRPETNGGGYGGGGAGNYNPPNNTAGGGGGGGYIGGNAGAVAGGNGGSSYTDASATNVTTNNHTDDNGSVVISVAATISYTGSPFCKSLTATAAPTITGYTGTDGTFSSFPTGLTIDATTGVINPSTSTAGSYQVRYNILNCTAVTAIVRIQAMTTPSVSISPTAICAGSSVTLTATATNGGSSPQFYWSKNNEAQGIADFINKTTADGLGNSSVYGVYVDNAGTIYAATNGGLSISTDGGTSFITKTTANGLGNSSVYGVYVDNAGKIYAATLLGGLSISSNGGTSFITKTTANGLGDNTVYGVYVDKDGTIYAATESGLSISSNGGSSFSNKTTVNGLGNNLVRGVYVDNAGKIYAATQVGLSISTDGGTSFSNKTTTANGLGSNNVYGVYVDNVGTIYAATQGGLSISTDGGATFSNKSFGSIVRGVYVDNAGTIYAVTQNVRLHISTDGGTSFINKTSANGLGNGTTSGVHVGTDGTIYVATAAGLSIASQTTGNSLAVTSAVAGDVYKVTLVSSADACSSVATAMASVTVGALPTISGPANLLDNNTIGQCGKIITYNTSTTGTPTPTISYTLTGATTGTGAGIGSGSFFNVGTTTVTLTATNSCGMGTYSFDITIKDTEKPKITCPPSQTLALGSFECGRVVLFADPSVTDNCSSPTFERTDAFKTSLKSGSSFSAGTYPLSYRATDAAGNFVDCNFTIQVNGQLTTGRLKCIPTLTVSLDERQCTNTLDAVGLLIDNTYYCSNFYNTSIPGRTNNYLTSADIGKTFTVTVGDNFNNSCSTIVTVVDTKAPVLNALQDAVVTCADVSRDGRILATLSQPTIIYECGKTTFRTQDRAINLPAGQTSFNTRPDGFPADKNFDFTSAFNASRIIVRTYTATDESNNTSSVQQVIYVKSIDLSQVECPRDVTLSCTQSGFSTDIQSAGIPFVRGGRSLQEVSCGIDYLYSDERTNNAQGYVIKRTFTLINLSNNLRQTCTQTITVNCVNIPLLAISGSINKETGESVSAMVKVANPTEMMAEMQGETFSFNNLVQGNSYRIQPERDNDVTNGVTTFDIALLSKHILGIQPFTSPYQMIAADVNRDGGIDATDMVLIRNLILRRITRFPSNTAWRFIPKSFVFADNKNPFADDFPEVLNYNNLSSNMNKADFVAVKVGDVNLNANAANVLTLSTRTARPTENIYLTDKRMDAGKEYIFDLNIKNSTLNALQLALKIDKSRVNSFSVEGGNLPQFETGNFEVNQNQGVVGMAWANTSKSTVLDENSIIQLKITPRQSAWLHELVSLDEQNMENLAYNTDPSRVLGEGIEKQIKLKFNAFKTENLEFALHQNRPNPFIAETTISFVLPETNNAILSIYDVNGREVYTMKQGFNKGYNEVKLDNTILKNAGIYFYRLQSDKFTATKRMQFFMN